MVFGTRDLKYGVPGPSRERKELKACEVAPRCPLHPKHRDAKTRALYSGNTTLRDYWGMLGSQ